MQSKGVRPRALLAVVLGASCVAALLIAWTVISAFTSHEGSSRSVSRAGRSESAVEISSNSHDFGAVLQSEMELTHRFPVTNRGERPVDVRVTRVACGCLEVTCPSQLSPGETGDCEARLTLGGREGPIDVGAQLETSEPGAPVLTLMVRCEIVPDVRVDPARLEFTGVRTNEILSAECQVITASASGIGDRVPAVECSTPRAGVVVQPLGTRRTEGLLNRLERTVHRFRVQIDTRKIEQRGGRASLPDAVVFRHSQERRDASLTIPVSVNFRHHNHLSGPTALTLRRDRTAGQMLTLKSIDGIPFQVTSARSASEELLLEIGETAPSVIQLVQVRLREPAARSERGISTMPIGQVIQKYSLTFVADQWPNEPYEVEVLLLP